MMTTEPEDLDGWKLANELSARVGYLEGCMIGLEYVTTGDIRNTLQRIRVGYERYKDNNKELRCHAKP